MWSPKVALSKQWPRLAIDRLERVVQILLEHGDVAHDVLAQPALGVGAHYGSCEGQDLTLRALAAGFRQYYDPALTGQHPDVLRRPDAATARKCRAYGRGMGYVLRQHGFGRAVQAKYLLRPLLRAGFNLARGRVGEANLALNTALGRWEGLSKCHPNP